MRSRQFALVLWLCSALLLPAYPQAALEAQEQGFPNELHEGLVGQIRKLNPLFANTNPVDRDISSLIYEGLTTINQYGEVVPDLAEGWIVSSNGLDYIFNLRQDVLWQDGISFTAADVAYTIRTLRHPDFPGDPALGEFWRTVEMTVIDEYTIRFRLVQPLASFPERLRQGIVPVHALEGAPVATLDQHPFNLSPIGTGPYQIESLFSENGRIIGISLRVAPNYRKRPEGAQGYALDRIVFRTYSDLEAVTQAYRAGEINSLGTIPNDQQTQYRQLPGTALHTSIAPAVGVLIYNWQQDDLAYFRDQRLRLALAYATDRRTAVQSAMGDRAVPADTPILPNSWAYNPNVRYPQPDMDEAQRLLESVSFEPVIPEDDSIDRDSPPTEEDEEQPSPTPVQQRKNFGLMVLDDPAVAGVAFEIANQWNQLGFNVELDMVDYPTLISRLDNGEFDTAIVEYSLQPHADPDQFVFWHSGQTEIGQNYGGMNDSYISSLIYEARTDPYNPHRKEYYDAFQEGFASRAPALVLYHPIFVYATDNRLTGVQLDFISRPSDRFRTIKQWRFEPN